MCNLYEHLQVESNAIVNYIYIVSLVQASRVVLVRSTLEFSGFLIFACSVNVKILLLFPQVSAFIFTHNLVSRLPMIDDTT